MGNSKPFKKKIMKIDAFKPLKLKISRLFPDPDHGLDPSLDPDLTQRLYGNIGRASGLEIEIFQF